MTIHLMKADLVLPVRADLGEGPVWDAARQRLLFVDITAGKIYEHDFDARRLAAIEAGALIGCVVPQADGQLVAGMADGIWRIERSTGARVPLVKPPEHDANRCRFNDGKCDPQGRLWAGTMGLNLERGLGALYCFPSATEYRCVLPSVSISNGLAWSLDGATLYYIDSPTRRVDAFDFDAATGGISHRRPAIVLPDGNDAPDGCTLDAEGMLWVAHWGGARVTRWNPRTGEHLASVGLPAPHVTSCCFGGAALDTLYITTARRGLTPPQLEAYPDSGGVFACRPGARGRPANVFRG